MNLELIDPLGIFVGIVAIAIGVLGVARPQTLFERRHPVGVSGDARLSDTGVLLYRVGGVAAILLGLWLVYDWGNLALMLRG